MLAEVVMAVKKGLDKFMEGPASLPLLCKVSCLIVILHTDAEIHKMLNSVIRGGECIAEWNISFKESAHIYIPCASTHCHLIC